MVGDGRYEYRENTYRLIFAFGPGEVVVQTVGINGSFCQCPDLRTGYGCGYNTMIHPATHKTEKKKRQPVPFKAIGVRMRTHLPLALNLDP